MTSPLADYLKQAIRLDGPMSLARYFNECLAHPKWGYYITRDPLGRAGDFTTAPEISQIFGELLGLWAVQCWQQMGAPQEFNLVETGPGRGTLMADALRAARLLPEFQQAARLHLMETSPALRAEQQQRLADYDPRWLDHLGDLPQGPTILFANEFFDALPLHQFVRRRNHWCERQIGLDNQDHFIWSEAPLPATPSAPKPLLDSCRQGDILELSPIRESMMQLIAEQLAKFGGYALLIDYGHGRSAPGDSFQALAGHEFCDPLAAPGEADLTSHVDFEALARSAVKAGARAWPLQTQGSFLKLLGIDYRLQQLQKAAATKEQAESLAAGVHRLLDEKEMGSLFKVLAVSGPSTPAPAGFEALDDRNAP